MADTPLLALRHGGPGCYHLGDPLRGRLTATAPKQRSPNLPDLDGAAASAAGYALALSGSKAKKKPGGMVEIPAQPRGSLFDLDSTRLGAEIAPTSKRPQSAHERSATLQLADQGAHLIVMSPRH